MKVLCALLMVGWLLASPGEERVLIAEVDGPITPVVADYLADAVERAEEADYQALVVLLDTPGGLDTSMREIVQEFLGARVPVVVYVSPSGARAASAGTFITMAAHVAAMAPATSIGAATPVDLQGGEIPEKVIEDAVAFAVSVAEERGRSVEFAEAAVREGRSLPASQAVTQGVVDMVSDDLGSLLEELDGRRVRLADGSEVTLSTADALADRFELGVFRSILARLADPNLAFLFLSLGTLAVVYEAANPGLGFAGIAGVILLILAFFALSILPVQGAGLALLVLGIALLVAELFVPGVGVLAAGGALALVLGGLFLFEGSVRVSPVVLWPSVLLLGAVSTLAGREAIKARRRPPTTGPEALVGRVARVRESSGEEGEIFLEGAWWRIRSVGGPLTEGDRVRVVEVDGLTLMVEPVEEKEET